MNKSILTSLAIVTLIGCGSAGDPSPGAASPDTKDDPVAKPLEQVIDVKDAGDPCTPHGATKSACVDDYSLFKDAKKACTTDGLILNEFKASESCGSGSSAEFSYTCCPTPPSCGSGSGDKGKKCSKGDSDFVEAEDSCPKGVATFELQETKKCASGSGKEFSFECSCL